MMAPRIAVVIPTFSRPHILALVLEGLCNQIAVGMIAEVLVVCDGFDEATRTVATGFSQRLPLRYLEQSKLGVSSARNLGIRSASSPIVLLLDDDVVPGPELIAEHVKFHHEQGDEQAVLLGYVTWHPDLLRTPFMLWYGEYGGLFGYGRLQDNRPAKAPFLYSCNVSFKRKFLLDADAFNTRLRVLEDYELGFRLAQRGMKLVHRKAAVGFHYQTFTFQQACDRLNAYSSGLDNFLATEAGRALARERRRIAFRAAEIVVRATAPLLHPLLSVIDQPRRMPNALYRLLYWHHASYHSFWSLADKGLRSGKLPRSDAKDFGAEL